MWRAGLVMMVLICSCAPAKVYEFQKSWTVPSTYDQTWASIVQLFAENGWPIATIEKDSGIIVSDWVAIATQVNYADCGSPGITIVQRREAKFNVFIRNNQSALTMTVNTNFRELRSFNYRSFYVDCNSTGSLETQLHNQIMTRIE